MQRQLVEADLYRFFHQNGAFPGSAFGYRDKAEETAWRERDPIVQLRREVLARDLATEAEVEAMTADIDATM